MQQLRLLFAAGIVAFGLGLNVLANAAAPKMKFLETIYFDDEGKGMQRPEGVACGSGVLWVGDSGNSRLLRYRTGLGGMEFDKKIEMKGAYPVRMALSPAGDVVVLDAKSKKVLGYDVDGQLKGEVKFDGIPESGNIVPRSIVFDRSGNLYVLDLFSARILVIQQGGGGLKALSLPPQGGFISDLALSSGGDVYVLDSVMEAVFVKDRDSDSFHLMTQGLEEDMNFPASLAVDPDGNLLLVDKYGSGLVFVGPDGAYMGRRLGMGWTDGQLRYPSQICVDGEGNLFVADRENNRVQRFALVGPDS